MIKYLSSNIVFQEIPNEISLAFEISNCPHRCKGCHTPELQQDIGTELTEDVLRMFIEKNRLSNNMLISCVLFLGGDQHSELKNLLSICKSYDLKTALYTGNDVIDDSLVRSLDYVKTGSYDESRGALKSESTNQVLNMIYNSVDIDTEYVKIVNKKFWDII